MRVLILTDEFFASRERGLVMRLEVGLADEGLRVIHAVPQGTKTDAPAGVFSRVLTYSTKTLILTRPLAVRKLVRAIAEMDQAEEPGGIDVIHVFGGSVWGLGADLAVEVGAGLALEVWRGGLVDRARDMKVGSDDLPLLLSPDPAIERALLQSTGGGPAATVRLAAWGVLTPPVQREVLVPERAPTVMLVGSGRDARALAAAVHGLAAIIKDRPDLLVFCDALAARRAGIWALARKLGILQNLSLIEELEGRRDLLLYGDVLLQPEAHGEQRSVLLEAMAGGMIVAAAQDILVSSLQDGVTARLVRDQRSAPAWEAVLREIVTDRDKSRQLATSAREWVRAHRRASDHVRAVLSAYEWLVSDEPIPFTPDAAP
jgi:glycosyltransferase involved in cell wall biosynthesis